MIYNDYSYLLISTTMCTVEIPFDIHLVEPCNGYSNIYSINRHGNLSWDIETVYDEVEEDETTLIVSSYIIHRLFSRSVKIYRIGKSIVLCNQNLIETYLRKGPTPTSVYV